MSTKKKIAIIANTVLLVWFFLDMIGITINNHILVSQSWNDDSIFFIIFALVFLLFLLKEKIGKYVLCVWLLLWFITQFFSHWFFTLVGSWENKIAYFSDTIKLIPSSEVYIPDLYHIVLHVLILFALISTIFYCFQTKKKRNENV